MNKIASLVKLGWGVFLVTLGIYVVGEGGTSIKDAFAKKKETEE